MNERPWYTIRQKAGSRKAALHLFGDISDVKFYEEDVTPSGIQAELNALEADELDVFIDSYGGSVAAGFALYNILRQHPATVNTYGVGFVASAALYPFMAGENRFACEPSAYFFHNVMGGADGYAEDLRKTADELDALSAIGRSVFSNAGNLTVDEVKQLQDNETWLSPQEMLRYGLATAVLNEAPTEVMQQSARRAVMQRVLAKQEPRSQAPDQKEPPRELSVIDRLAGKK